MKTVIRYSLCAMATAMLMGAPGKAFAYCENMEYMEAMVMPGDDCGGGGGGGGYYNPPPQPPPAYEPPPPPPPPVYEPPPAANIGDFKGRKINKKTEVTGNFTAMLKTELQEAATEFITGLLDDII